ncbi:MAG: osmotically inducible protein OsmC [Acidobacteria bacterium]|nr:MAG: osmotically inducible protein OsmC [Acidobacteriota bacterium]
MASTFKATIEHVNHTTSRAVVRSHTMLVDRGVAKGGFDLGPAGGEYQLVALGGCFTSHLLAAIRARETALTNVKVAVTGTLDGTPERFTGFTVDVTADGDADLARKLITIASRACQVMNTLRQSTPIEISYQGAPIESAEAVA